jgi:glycosyltransferase involved in cell wall biosynthesis/2-polyprenyl-3-methyl-5-hydroxy-6-metoxy-1,4-benzoquinol methylase
MTDSALPVLVIGPTPPPLHGVAVATQTLLRARSDQRLIMWHLDIADRRGIEHVDRPDLHDVVLFCRQWLKLAWLLASRRPRVVYLSISQSTIGIARDGLFVLLARLFGARVVIHLHGGNLPAWFAERGALLRACVRWILGSCVRFIVLAETFRRPLAALVAPEKIVVVPNGVAATTPATAPAIPHLDSRCRLLFLSTLSRAKGVLVLLEAVAQLVRQGAAVELVLAGPWLREDDRAAALRLVEEHRLEEVVRFAGVVQPGNKAGLLSWADLFVFPGIQQEGQPLVVIEAMAAGLPVLFSDRGCLADTVGDGECGLMVRVGDCADLAAKIAWLAERPDVRRRLGESARHRYEARFTETQFLANITAVLLAAGAASDGSGTGDQRNNSREYFDRVAVQFHKNYVKQDAFKERRELWERLIHDSLQHTAPGGLCMDMGCGDGTLGRIAAAAGVTTLGVDQSESMLALARAHAREQRLDGRMDYIRAGLPLPGEFLTRYRGRADLILCSSVLEYIDSYEEVLCQFLELLKEGGRLIVSVPNGHSVYRWGERLLGLLRSRHDSYLRYQRHVFYPQAFKARMRQLGYAPLHEEFFALPFQGLSSRLVGAHRGKRTATLYLLMAEKSAVAAALTRGLAA